MEVFVRYLTKKRDGAIATRDESVSCEVLRFGRGTFNEVQLAGGGVLLSEGVLHLRNQTLFFDAESPTGNISINGKPQRHGPVEIGSTIGIGSFDVKVIEQPEGYDVAVSVEMVRPVSDSLENLKRNSTTRIEQSGLSKRLLAWVTFVIIAMLFLVWPLVDIYVLDKHSSEDNFTMAGAMQSSLERDPWPLAADLAWVTGEISGPHKFIAQNCSICHQEPFQQVSDSVCSTCHTEVRHHVDPDGYYDMPELTVAACQSCHKEHQGSSPIVRQDQSFCASCHLKIEQVASEAKLRDVSDFGRDHPEFRPTVVVDASLGKKERILLDPARWPVEDSNLRFPHNKHLKAEGVLVPSTREFRKLDCSSCHQSTGLGFAPVVMESQCGECHLLNFEPAVPDRILPHGDASLVMLTIREFYSELALRGSLEDGNAPEVLKRRRPGGDDRLNDKEQLEVANWVDSKVQQAAKRIFSPALCGTCHKIKELADSSSSYQVAAVSITDQWLPKGLFDHSRHNTSECGICHEAVNSTSASDVLLPSVAVCKTCHGGENASQRVPSTCITCHDFHSPHHSIMRGRMSGDASLRMLGDQKLSGLN